MKKIAYIAAVVIAAAACSKETKPEEGGVKINSFAVVPETKTVYTDEALPELNVKIDPQDADVTVEWTSSDPAVVTVSDKGELAFAVKDIEDAEKTVTITAKAGEHSATCTLTVKGQISRYEVLDFTEDFGFQMLDRNVGAKTKEETGNYYQWGKNAFVASNDDTEVNANYDAAWGPESEGFADWTVAENTPCPKGWSLPAGDKIAKFSEYVDIISTYEFEYYEMGFEGDELTYTYDQYDAAYGKLESLELVATGKFAGAGDKFGKTTLEAPSFWTGVKNVNEKDGTTTISYYENNYFPTIAKGGAFTTAMTVRCVK